MALASTAAGAEMTLYLDAILGALEDERFVGRRVERISVDSAQAAKRRLRAETDAATDVAIDLPRGAYLADGAVLHDDGERVIAVVRTPEPALVVRFDPELLRDRLAAQAAELGHAFGNQHVPLDIEQGTVRVPLTTTEQIARRTVDALQLEGVEMVVELVALGARRPLARSHSHA